MSRPLSFYMFKVNKTYIFIISDEIDSKWQSVIFNSLFGGNQIVDWWSTEKYFLNMSFNRGFSTVFVTWEPLYIYI